MKSTTGRTRATAGPAPKALRAVLIIGVIMAGSIVVFLESRRRETSRNAMEPSDQFSFETFTIKAPAKFEQTPDEWDLILSDASQSLVIPWASLVRDENQRPISYFPVQLLTNQGYTFMLEKTLIVHRFAHDPDGIYDRRYQSLSPVRILDGQQVIYDREICEVHNIAMQRKRVSVDFGDSSSAFERAPTDAEIRTRFPHYKEMAEQRSCKDMMDSQFIDICASCKSAHSEWLSAFK